MDNVIVSEGGIGRKFAPVQKLKTNLSGGGDVLWVAEDNAKTGDANITSNGVYSAVEEELFAYDEVTVDVIEDITDPSQTGSLTGTDPDTGNDYEYNLNEDGTLDVSLIPSAIHIVVKPRKLKYEEGEVIDFTGIHIYLMDGNNRRFTSTDYPTGEIPFDELIFPVTTAEQEGDTDVYTDGSGIYAMFTIFDKYMHNAYGDFYVGSPIGFISDGEWAGWEGGTMYATCTENGVSAYITKVFEVRDGRPDAWILYGYSDDTKGRYVDATYNPATQSGRHGYGSRFEKGQWTILQSSVVSHVINAWSKIPVSDHDPTGTDPNTFESGIEIPVQWMRSDGEILEDTFEIEVGEGGEPGPPEPDPWAGNYDVSWNGHTYNINRRIVPEVHYANGYCWQEGTTEYTVEQAVGFGWLIRVGM